MNGGYMSGQWIVQWYSSHFLKTCRGPGFPIQPYTFIEHVVFSLCMWLSAYSYYCTDCVKAFLMQKIYMINKSLQGELRPSL